MTKLLSLPLIVFIVAIAGCNPSDTSDAGSLPKPSWVGVELETRTFKLQHMEPSEAAALVGPYVYVDRPGAPGALSYFIGTPLISVRETPDNLDKIGRMLTEFDAGRSEQQFRLHFQIVDANGTATNDPRLEVVEQELRKVFRFEGYTLIGEAHVTASTGRFEVNVNRHIDRLNASATPVRSRQTYRISGEILQDAKMSLNITMGQGEIRTSFSFYAGQTVVLGSMTIDERTVFVVLHIEESTDQST